MKKIIVLICVVLIPIGLVGQSFFLSKHVVANGGSISSASNIKAGLTIGQVFIGPSQASDEFAGIGFWYSVENIGTSVFFNESDYSQSPLLYQNVPNPFMNLTEIRFKLPYKSDVHLVIRNVYGQVVKTMIKETLNSGEHIYYFEAEGFPGGQYFATLSVNGLQITKKMILVSR